MFAPPATAEGRKLGSDYDDELWLTVPEDPGPPPTHLVELVHSLPAAADVLDLGCGDGRLTAEIRRAESLTAADVSRVALDRAARRLPHARLVELDPDAPLPFDDGSFDLIVCVETIEHVRDLQRLLSEVRRALRPGGTLALTTPAHGRLTGARAMLLGWESVADPLSPHIRLLSRRSLRRLMHAMSFETASLGRRGGSLTLLARR